MFGSAGTILHPAGGAVGGGEEKRWLSATWKFGPRLSDERDGM